MPRSLTSTLALAAGCFLGVVSACSDPAASDTRADGDADRSSEVSPDSASADSLVTPDDFATSAIDGGQAAVDALRIDAYRGEVSGDAARIDARTLTDGSDLDLGSSVDARMDSPLVACTVNGVSGTCMTVSLCTGTASAGYCPGAATIQCCTPNNPNASWCPTDASARPNEGLTEAPGTGGCPSGQVPIAQYCYSTPPDARNNINISPMPASGCPAGTLYGAPFCIDQFEASIVVKSAGTEVSWTPYYEPKATDTYRAVSIAGAIPQGYISGNDAKRACEASGKTLCSDRQWQRACRGLANHVYPYGNTRIAGRCNDESLHPNYSPAVCFASNASWIFSHLDYAGINQQANTVAPTGSFADCVTDEGVFDMMGNVHDWIYDPLNLTAPTKGVDFRGGFYNDTKINGEGCLYNTDAHGLGQVDYSVGFRCCSD